MCLYIHITALINNKMLQLAGLILLMGTREPSNNCRRLLASTKRPPSTRMGRAPAAGACNYGCFPSGLLALAVPQFCGKGCGTAWAQNRGLPLGSWASAFRQMSRTRPLNAHSGKPSSSIICHTPGCRRPALDGCVCMCD